MMKEVDFRNIKTLNKNDKYETVIKEAKSLVDGESNLTANLSNITSLLHNSFDYYSWTGFYIYEAVTEQLVLGPFQGKLACTRIDMGKGVCGTAALKKKTIVVADVNKFPGHIFCDADSKSEIVVPIMTGGGLFGVLDIDSAGYSSFDDTDRKMLEKLVNEISFIFK